MTGKGAHLGPEEGQLFGAEMGGAITTITLAVQCDNATYDSLNNELDLHLGLSSSGHLRNPRRFAPCTDVLPARGERRLQRRTIGGEGAVGPGGAFAPLAAGNCADFLAPPGAFAPAMSLSTVLLFTPTAAAMARLLAFGWSFSIKVANDQRE